MSPAIATLVDLLLLFSIPASGYWWVHVIRQRRLAGRPWTDLLDAEPRPRPFWGPEIFLVMVGGLLVISTLIQSVYLSSQPPRPADQPPPAASALARPIASDVDAEPGGQPPKAAGDATAQVNENLSRRANDALSPAREEPPARSLLPRLIAHSVASATVVLLTVAFCCLCRPDAIKQLGLWYKAGDVRLGLEASLMLIPPLWLIMSLVSWFVPYQHAVISALSAAPNLITFATLFFATVVITPLAEEFAMRVILQGGLQGLADRLADPPNDSSAWRPVAVWPVYATSLLFALLHFGQGAAWIPLFFLSLGLGYLYRQTGRIGPSLIVHMVLNGITMSIAILEASGST